MGSKTKGSKTKVSKTKVSNTKVPAEITENHCSENHCSEIESDADVVTVRYSSTQAVSRRRFLSGSLALSGSLTLGGSAMLASTGAFAADCDRNAEQVRRCSDGDTGQSADPVNCGRCGQESTVPSGYRVSQPAAIEGIESPGVKKISD